MQKYGAGVQGTSAAGLEKTFIPALSPRRRKQKRGNKATRSTSDIF